jgi:hypothetical protein
MQHVLSQKEEENNRQREDKISAAKRTTARESKKVDKDEIKATTRAAWKADNPECLLCMCWCEDSKEPGCKKALLRAQRQSVLYWCRKQGPAWVLIGLCRELGLVCCN